MPNGEASAAIAHVILDFIKAPWKLFVVIFVICVLALIIPNSWIETMGMTAWVAHFHPWIVIGFLFCGLSLIVTGIDEWTKPARARLRHRRETEEKFRKLENTLKSLRMDEIGTLGVYGSGHSTQSFHNGHGIVNNLVNKGILYCASNKAEYGGYCLTEDIVAYLDAKNFKTVAEAATKLQERTPAATKQS